MPLKTQQTSSYKKFWRNTSWHRAASSILPGFTMLIIFMAVIIFAHTQTRQENTNIYRGDQYALFFAPGSDMTANIVDLYDLTAPKEAQTYIVRSGFFDNILIVQSSRPDFEIAAKQALTHLWFITDPIFAGGCNPSYISSQFSSKVPSQTS